MAKISRTGVFVFFSLFIFFLILNFCQPLEGDDLTRFSMNVLYHNNLINQLFIDYNSLTGRLSAQVLVYVFLNKNYPMLVDILNILNSIILSLFIIVLYKIITCDETVKSKKFIVYLAIFLTLFSFNNAIGQILMKTVALQYFWGIAALVFFYYYCFVKNNVSITLSIILGFIIGTYNEAIFMVCFVISFFYILLQLGRKENINKSIYFFLFFLSVGGIILACAPGSYSVVVSRNHQTIFQLMISGSWKYLFMIFTETEVSILFILAVVCTLFFEKNKYTKLILTLCLVFIWLTIYPIMFGFVRRVSIIYMLVYFSVIGYYISNFSYKIRDYCLKNYKFFVVLIILMMSLLLYVFIKLGYYQSRRFEELHYYRSVNQENISLKPINFIGLRLADFTDIKTDSKEYDNTAFAKAYGFKSVTLSTTKD